MVASFKEGGGGGIVQMHFLPHGSFSRSLVLYLSILTHSYVSHFAGPLYSKGDLVSYPHLFWGVVPTSSKGFVATSYFPALETTLILVASQFSVR